MSRKLLYKEVYVPRQKHPTLFNVPDAPEPEWETCSCPSPSRSAELSFYFLLFSEVFVIPRLVPVFCFTPLSFTPWLLQYVTHHLYSFPELLVIPFDSAFIYFMRAETVSFVSPYSLSHPPSFLLYWSPLGFLHQVTRRHPFFSCTHTLWHSFYGGQRLWLSWGLRIVPGIGDLIFPFPDIFSLENCVCFFCSTNHVNDFWTSLAFA